MPDEYEVSFRGHRHVTVEADSPEEAVEKAERKSIPEWIVDDHEITNLEDE